MILTVNTLILVLGALFALIIIMLLVIYLLETASYLRLYRAIPSNLGKAIYGYLDKNGDLITFTDELNTLLNNSKKKKLNKLIKKIYYDNKEITYNKFLNVLKNKEGQLNFVFDLDDESINITFKKSVIYKDDKIIGYALLEQNEEFKIDNAKEFMEVIDELEAPCAYFYGYNKDTNFSLNHTLQSLLHSKEKKMTYESLKKYVFEEDLQNFYSSSNENVNNIRTKYRLLTTQGLMTFEEVKRFNSGKVTSLIMHIESIDEKVFVENEELMKNIDSLVTNCEFGGFILSFQSLLDNHELNAQNIVKDVIKKYMKIVNKDILNPDDIVGKLNEFEYVIIMKDLERFDNLVNDICTNKSILLHDYFEFCNQLVKINNNVGISYYNDLNMTRKEYLNSLYQALALANDSKYDKNYSIYSPAKETKTEEEYSFDKVMIDLDNSFLHDDN